jgi:hypothetical protein
MIAVRSCAIAFLQKLLAQRVTGKNWQGSLSTAQAY